MRSAPEVGRATEEALSALADALGVAPSRLSLRTGSRSRTKVFEVAGMDDAAAFAALRARA